MSYSDIVKNTSHISEKDILKRVSDNDIFVPLKEALKNSLEAIKLKNNNAKNEYKDSEILISIYTKKDVANEIRLDYIEIKDNGRGFTRRDFERFCQYINESKGYNNKGTGRFYLIKMFDNAVYDSVCLENKQYYNINFDFSTKNPSDDMFIKVIKEAVVSKADVGTILKLYPFDEDYRRYNFFLDLAFLRQAVVESLLLEFLLHIKTSIPKIAFKKYFENKVIDSCLIDKFNIPSIDKEDTVSVNFYKMNYEEKTVEKTDNKIKLKLYSTKSSSLKRSEIVLTSANQKVEAVNFQDLLPSDQIGNEKVVLFVKSEYLDNVDNIDDGRKRFNFYKKSDLEKIVKKDEIQSDMGFSTDEYMLKDELTKEINKKFSKMYPDIKKIKTEKELELQKLKRRFLISDEIFNKVTKKLGVNATSEEVFTEFYRAEAEVLAKKDMEISNKIDEVITIDVSNKNCMEKLDELSESIVKLIPLQNRNSLAQYVARRKLVLKAFDNILKNTKGDVQEKHLHNLFLLQGKDNNYEDSNLWMLGEDFIYFAGKSQEKLCNYTLKGKKIFNSKFSKEEERYLTSLGEDRKLKIPDILLFPEENKCIIIEFKKADVNVADHLNQISKYASLIRNFANEQYEFKQFFGYLIGEAIEVKDVRGADPDFKEMYQGKGLFRPKKAVACFEDSNKDGEIYMEVLSYSNLLDKASCRNKIFIEKLGIQSKDGEADV